MSELEIAEMLLEERKSKKKRPQRSNGIASNETQNNESPLVRKKRIVKRIHSDSDDSI